MAANDSFQEDVKASAAFYARSWPSWPDVEKRVALPEVPLILARFAHISSSDAVLDVGCGTGRILEGLSGITTRLHGVELSFEAARLTRDRGLRAVQASAFSLPFPADCFDCVICNDVLPNLSPTLTSFFLRELVRVSRDRVVLGALRNRIAAFVDLSTVVRSAIQGRFIDAANVNSALYGARDVRSVASDLGTQLVHVQPAAGLVALFERYPWYKRLYRVRPGRIGLFGWLLPSPSGLLQYDVLLKKVGKQ